MNRHIWSSFLRLCSFFKLILFCKCSRISTVLQRRKPSPTSLHKEESLVQVFRFYLSICSFIYLFIYYLFVYLFIFCGYGSYARRSVHHMQYPQGSEEGVGFIGTRVTGNSELPAMDVLGIGPGLLLSHLSSPSEPVLKQYIQMK